MSTSETAEVREWLETREYGTWFWGKEVPGRREIVHPALSRLHSDKSSGVVRVAKDLYWCGWPPGHEYAGFSPDYQIGALLLAGPGAGLAEAYALNRLAWSTQVPHKYLISTARKPPKPFHSTVIYMPRKNERRTALNWTEVTLLEALQVYAFIEEPWHQCLDSICDGSAFNRLPWEASINPDGLRWATETEETSEEALHMIDEVVSALQR